MENNCLKTTLKGVIQNDNLMKFGEIIFDVHKLTGDTYTKDGAKFRIDVPSGKTCNINVKGDGYFVTDWNNIDEPSAHLTSYTGDGTIILYMANEDFKLSITSKYDFIYISNSRGSSPKTSSVIINLKDMEYLTNLTTLNVGLASTNGDTKYLKNLAELTNINLWVDTVTGHITDFGNMKKLSNSLYLNDTYIEGAIEDFCDMQVSGTDGRTSGSITLYCSRSLTYQGSELANRTEKTIRFGSSMVNPTSDETSQGWQVV